MARRDAPRPRDRQGHKVDLPCCAPSRSQQTDCFDDTDDMAIVATFDRGLGDLAAQLGVAIDVVAT